MVSKRLTARGVDSLRNAKRNRLVSDGDVRGLYLKTTASGSASWIYRWRDRLTGRLRDKGLGSVADVSLAEAREEAINCRRQVLAGLDPIAEALERRSELAEERASLKTFEEVSKAYYSAKVQPTGHSEKHKKRWQSIMREHVYPGLGPVYVHAATTADVRAALEPIWDTKLETARKARQQIEQVFSFAKTAGLREGENPARWEGNLKNLLADPREVRKGRPVQHRAALPWQQVPQFLKRLRTRNGMAARALEFAVQTAARSAEAREASWSEIDLQARIWTVGASRMKGRSVHKVPLSIQSVALLEALPHRTGLLFPSSKNTSLTDAALSKALGQSLADGVKATVHGFRSSFKDWARNRTKFADEVSELALAHVNSDATRAAYARDELLELRVELMRMWSEYLDGGGAMAAPALVSSIYAAQDDQAGEHWVAGQHS